MEQRIENLEGEVRDIWKEVDTLKSAQTSLKISLELIMKEMEYTKKALDKIDANVELLRKSEHKDHYEDPLAVEKVRKERRRSQIENIVIGFVIGYLLVQLFPALAH